MPELLAQLFKLLKELMPTFILALFNYEQGVIDQEKKKLDAANLTIKEGQNKDEIDSEYADKSDLDIINQSIIDGADAPKPKSDK